MKYKEIVIKKADCQSFLKTWAKDYKRDNNNFKFDAALYNNLPTEIAKEFEGKPEIFFVFWLNKVSKLSAEEEDIKLEILPINKSNIEIPPIKDRLLGLEIDLEGFDIEGLEALQKAIQNRKEPIHSITLKNAGTLDVKGFIDGIHNVEFIHVEGSPDLQEIAKQTTYRNHLIRQLGVEFNDDLWPNIISAWYNTPYYQANSAKKPGYGGFYTVNDDNVRTLTYLRACDYDCLWVYKSMLKEDLKQYEEFKDEDVQNFEKYTILNNSIIALGDLFFNKMLEHLEDNLDTDNLTELKFDIVLNQNNIDELAKWIESYGSVSFASLELTIDDSVNLKKLLTSLNGRSVKHVTLTVADGPWESKYSDLINDAWLAENAENDLDYPLTIKSKSYSSNRDGFLKALASNLQKHNQEKLKNPIIDDVELDVESVEVAQLEDQIDETVEEQAEEQQQDYENFDGRLIGFKDFFGGQYSGLLNTGPNMNVTSLVEQDILMNLPHAIKFLSPDAAGYLARNATVFATLNAEEYELPQGFSIKKTAKGELVLDYDKYAEKTTSVFAPKPALFRSAGLSYKVYDFAELSPLVSDINKVGFREEYFFVRKHHEDPLAPDLLYMLNTSGLEKTKVFLNNVLQVKKTHPDFSKFLYDRYLLYFQDWNDLLSNSNFYDALTAIKDYDPIKYKCFKRFIENAGPLRVDLKEIVDGFDEFWREYTALCKQRNVEESRIIDTCLTLDILNNDYYKPQEFVPEIKWCTSRLLSVYKFFITGHPCVYMKRLLTILQNSRNLSEQFDCLDHVGLGNYEAYYASKHEGFKVVSEEMALKCNRKEQDAFEFSPDRLVYRVELKDIFEWLAQNKKGDNFKEFQVLAYRFLGTREGGITIPNFTKLLKEYEKLNADKPLNPDVIVNILFFISHEKYENNTSLIDLIKALEKRTDLQEINKALLDLHRLNIKLNPAQGLVIANMPAKELSELFSLLRDDEKRPGALSMLSSMTPNTKLGTVMGSVKYLAKKYNDIGLIYKNDIPLFCTLLQDANESKLDAIGGFLSQAAVAEKPNAVDTAFRLITNSRKPFTCDEALAAFGKLAQINPYNEDTVRDILSKSGFVIKEFQETTREVDTAFLKSNLASAIITVRASKIYGIKTPYYMAVTFKRLMEIDTELASIGDISDAVVLAYKEKLLSELKDLQKEPGETLKLFQDIISNRTVKDLFKLLQTEVGSCDTISRNIINPLLNELPNALRTPLIDNVLLKVGEKSGLYRALKYNLQRLKDSKADSFDELTILQEKVEEITDLFLRIKDGTTFKSHEKEFLEALGKASLGRLTFDSFSEILTAIIEMPNRDCLGIFINLTKSYHTKGKKVDLKTLLRYVKLLHEYALPSTHIANLIALLSKEPGKDAYFEGLINNVIAVFKQNPNDASLDFINKNFLKLGVENVSKLLAMVVAAPSCSTEIAKLSAYLNAKQPPQLSVFLKAVENKPAILEIIARSHAATKIRKGADVVSYTKLITSIDALDKENLDMLLAACRNTTLNIPCISNGLATRDKTKPFDKFLADLEKEPFGKRNLDEQFDTSQVERVINGLVDLNNKSKYTYLYRKQLMEAFLFVNAAGRELPIYNGRAAKDLSNQEIQTLFRNLRSPEFRPDLKDFNRRLYALALMREAMYRATNQQPNSTQMISILDCMMHKADVITNLDTGQGKSLVDVMKASLLWLEGGRVDITTSSLADARRDIENYFPYLDLLNIPNGKKPITSKSDFDDFQQDGINISTFSQLSLFYAKAIYEGKKFTSNIASLVIGESDHAILNDLVIYRYATTEGAPVKPGNEWIYKEINEYVDSIRKKPSVDQIKGLRKHLQESIARHKKKPAEIAKTDKMIKDFSDDQLKTWLDSARSVKFKLRENRHYVLSKDKEYKEINGSKVLTRVARILMKDGRVSPDTQYGKGVQQLLYARLNKQNGNDDFVIEPESKTIWSSNNKNLIDYYRSLVGFIWGSSGTVGSNIGVQEQYDSYGFEFSKVEPHQKNIVQRHKIIVTKDEDTHLAKLKAGLRRKRVWDFWGTTTPDVVFCKDIDTAKAWFEKLSKDPKFKGKIQLFTGLEDERQVIDRASEPGMITISTKAIGRNTDIAMVNGLDIWINFVASEAEIRQMEGRTGRQGAYGNIHHIYNEKDLGGKEVRQLQETLDEIAKTTRTDRQRLYDVLGYFGRIIQEIEPQQNITKQDLLKQWADCRESIEKKYASLKDKDSFNGSALGIFKSNFSAYNQVKGINARALEQYVNKKHTVVEGYKPYEEKVKLADCTSPSIIAYNIVGVQGDKKVNPEAVKNKLKALFAGIKRGVLEKSNIDYLTYLSTSQSNLELLKKVHSEFISDFLREERDHSKNMNFFKRWLGYESSLSKISNDRNYLLMFKALSDTKADKVEDIKASIITLLDDYLATSWFARSRKKDVDALKDSLGQATSIKEILELLTASKVKVIEADMRSDKTRILKRVNYFGNSRFQNTLDAALNLTTALSGEPNAALIPSLLATVGITEAKTFDTLKRSLTSLQHQSPTAKVVIKGIEKAMKGMLDVISEGMMSKRASVSAPNL